MYIIFTTPDTDIVESVSSIEKIHQRGPELSSFVFSAPSRFKNGENTNSHIFETSEGLPDDIMSKPDKYVYRNNKFYLRPFIRIEVDDIINRMGANGVVVRINQDIRLNITHHDPDNVAFSFDYIKFKDRYNFIDVPDKLYLTNGSTTVIINSPFPGVAKFRAKDNRYSCYFEPMEVRFKHVAI